MGCSTAGTSCLKRVVMALYVIVYLMFSCFGSLKMTWTYPSSDHTAARNFIQAFSFCFPAAGRCYRKELRIPCAVICVVKCKIGNVISFLCLSQGEARNVGDMSCKIIFCLRFFFFIYIIFFCSTGFECVAVPYYIHCNGTVSEINT